MTNESDRRTEEALEHDDAEGTPPDDRANQRDRSNQGETDDLVVGPNVPIDGGELGERSDDVMPDVPSKPEEGEAA